jgi:glycosyltransferase involved in cell wall biosynthesis
MTYASLGEVDTSIEIKSVCIHLRNTKADIEALHNIGATILVIKNRRDFSWINKLSTLIKAEKPDVIFTHGFNGAIMMLIERLFKGIKVPVICSYHGPYHAPSFFKIPLEPIYNYLSIFIYKHIALKIICVEQMSRNFLIGKGVRADKVLTVYNGIIPQVSGGINPFAGMLKQNEISLVTASRITSVKGLSFLLDALEILKQNTSIPFRYFMIGEGPELRPLKTKAKTLGIDDVIDFPGYQSNIASWLAHADIFLMPSLSEAHSIGLLEAMRAGKAIVATHVGGNPESIRNGIDGILVPAQNAEALAEGIKKLLESKELRSSLGQSARQRFLDNFTEDQMKANLIKTLNI